MRRQLYVAAVLGFSLVTIFGALSLVAAQSRPTGNISISSAQAEPDSKLTIIVSGYSSNPNNWYSQIYLDLLPAGLEGPAGSNVITPDNGNAELDSQGDTWQQTGADSWSITVSVPNLPGDYTLCADYGPNGPDYIFAETSFKILSTSESGGGTSGGGTSGGGNGQTPPAVINAGEGAAAGVAAATVSTVATALARSRKQAVAAVKATTGSDSASITSVGSQVAVGSTANTPAGTAEIQALQNQIKLLQTTATQAQVSAKQASEHTEVLGKQLAELQASAKQVAKDTSWNIFWNDAAAVATVAAGVLTLVAVGVTAGAWTAALAVTAVVGVVTIAVGVFWGLANHSVTYGQLWGFVGGGK